MEVLPFFGWTESAHRTFAEYGVLRGLVHLGVPTDYYFISASPHVPWSIPGIRANLSSGAFASLARQSLLQMARISSMATVLCDLERSQVPRVCGQSGCATRMAV